MPVKVVASFGTSTFFSVSETESGWECPFEVATGAIVVSVQGQGAAAKIIRASQENLPMRTTCHPGTCFYDPHKRVETIL